MSCIATDRYGHCKRTGRIKRSKRVGGEELSEAFAVSTKIRRAYLLRTSRPYAFIEDGKKGQRRLETSQERGERGMTRRESTRVCLDSSMLTLWSEKSATVAIVDTSAHSQFRRSRHLRCSAKSLGDLSRDEVTDLKMITDADGPLSATTCCCGAPRRGTLSCD